MQRAINLGIVIFVLATMVCTCAGQRPMLAFTEEGNGGGLRLAHLAQDGAELWASPWLADGGVTVMPELESLVMGGGTLSSALYSVDLTGKDSANAVVSVLSGSPSETGSATGGATSARFTEPDPMDVDSQGNVYVADTSAQVIRKVTQDGVVADFVDSLSSVRAIAVDRVADILYYADTDTVHAYTLATDLSSVVATGGLISDIYDMVVDSATGDLYVTTNAHQGVMRIAGTNQAVTTFVGDAGATATQAADGVGTAAIFAQPRALALAWDHLFVADWDCSSGSTQSSISKVDLATATATLMMGTHPPCPAPPPFASPQPALAPADSEARADDRLAPRGVVQTGMVTLDPSADVAKPVRMAAVLELCGSFKYPEDTTPWDALLCADADLSGVSAVATAVVVIADSEMVVTTDGLAFQQTLDVSDGGTFTVQGVTVSVAEAVAVSGSLVVRSGGLQALNGFTLASTGMLVVPYERDCVGCDALVDVTGDVSLEGLVVVQVGADTSGFESGAVRLLFRWSGDTVALQLSLLVSRVPSVGASTRATRGRRRLLAATSGELTCSQTSKQCSVTASNPSLANDDDDELGLILGMAIVAAAFVAVAVASVIIIMKLYKGGHGNFHQRRMEELEAKRLAVLQRRTRRANPSTQYQNRIMSAENQAMFDDNEANTLLDHSSSLSQSSSSASSGSSSSPSPYSGGSDSYYS